MLLVRSRRLHTMSAVAVAVWYASGAASRAYSAFHVASSFRGGLARTTFGHQQRTTTAARLLSMTTTSTTAATTSNDDTTSETSLINGRISRNQYTSPDAKTCSEALPLVLSHLKSRRASDETLSAAKQIASLNEERVSLIQRRDKALSVRKEQSAIVGKLMRTSEEDRDESALEEAKALSTKATTDADTAETQLADIELTMTNLVSSIPNLLDDVVPDGNDDTENEVVMEWGDITSLPKELNWSEDFKPKWHDDVATTLDGWESEKAVSMSGSRFVALMGNVARLERAISSFFLDMHVNQNDYTEVSVPLVVSRTALEGTSQLPKFEDDLFKITPESHTCNGEDAFLIPTAEVPLTNLHRESILDEDDLPLSYVALTPCFRAEAGSYGRDTRGLIRTHQFTKVELVKITTPKTSDEQHELLTQHAQQCLEALKLPYRKVRLCSGDVGFAARHCYDLEVYLPSTGEYREISSSSNTGDFQSRRMGLRYRPKPPPASAEDSASPDKKNQKKKKKAKKPKPELCHTINGSGLAIGRTLVAVLENYQMEDGNVLVPEVLRPYMGGMEILKKKK